MDKRIKLCQAWCAKRIKVLSAVTCLIFLCAYGIFFCMYQRNLQRQRMQMIGSIYLQEEDVARVVLNQMMREGNDDGSRMKAEKAAAEAIEKFGYTREAFVLSDWKGAVLFGGGMTGLVLLFVGGILLIGIQWRRTSMAEYRQLYGWLQDGWREMRAVTETDIGEWNGNENRAEGAEDFDGKREAALARREHILRRESVKFAAETSRMLGSAMADWIAQYQILWENQTKLRQRMKTFTENIAHQLKTPLTRMTLALDMMEAENMTGKREICLQELEQVKPLVEGILNISRMESGRVTLMSKPADLLQLLHDAVRKTGQRERYRWEFRGNIHEELIFYGDEVWLTQAFFNLYENAARYTTEGGVIETEVFVEAGGIRLEIRDEGGEIPQQVMHAMFERFYSADSQDLTRTGIGLNLARAIVEKHHGRMQVYNEEGGAVFSVYLPVYPLKGEKIKFAID